MQRLKQVVIRNELHPAKTLMHNFVLLIMLAFALGKSENAIKQGVLADFETGKTLADDSDHAGAY